VWTVTQPAGLRTIALFFAIWTLSAFVSGIIAISGLFSRSYVRHLFVSWILPMDAGWQDFQA
jgi:hypothetical protein